MPWTPEQQKRLNRELELLREYFPEFKPRYEFKQIYLEGWMKTNLGTKYNLRLFVPPDLPNSVPMVLITYPNNLNDYKGRRLVDYGQSENMHLLEPLAGYPCICTYKPSHWNPNLTFYNILVKVRIWLEAYQGHKVTGKPMDYYIRHQD